MHIYDFLLFKIALLRDILGLWRIETEKKPSKITYEDSLKELGLDVSQLNEYVP